MNKTAIWFFAAVLGSTATGALVANAAVGDVIFTKTVQLTLDSTTGAGATLKSFVETRAGEGQAKAISCRLEDDGQGADQWQCGLRVVVTDTPSNYLDRYVAGDDISKPIGRVE